MKTVGRRSLGWRDAYMGGAGKVFVLPRNRGESRADYARRFFDAIRGLGHVFLYLGNRRIARRGW